MRQSKTQRRAPPSAPAPSNVSEGVLVTLAISSKGAAAGSFKDTRAPADQVLPALMSSLTKAAATGTPFKDTYAVSDTAAGRHKARSAAQQQLGAEPSDASVTIRHRTSDRAPPRPAAPRPSSRIMALPNGDLVLLPRHMARAATTTSAATATAATASAMHSAAGRSFPAGHAPWREPRGYSVPAAVWLAEEEAYTDESVRSAGLALSPRPTPRALQPGSQATHPRNGEDMGMARAEGAGLVGYSPQPPQHAAPVSLRPRSAARGVYAADRAVLPPVAREEDGGVGGIGGFGGVGGIGGIGGIGSVSGIGGIGGISGGGGIGGIGGNEGRQSPTAPQVQRLVLLPSLHADRQGEDQAEAGRAGYTGPTGSTEAAAAPAATAVLVMPALSSSRIPLLVEEETAGLPTTGTEGLGDPLGDPRAQHHLEAGHRRDVYAVGTSPGQPSIGELEQQQQQHVEIQAAGADVGNGGSDAAVNGGTDARASYGAPEPARPQSVWHRMWRAVRPRCFEPDKRLVEV